MLCKAIGAVPVPRTDDWLVPAFYESGNHPENGQGTFMCSSKQMGSCLGEATYTTSSRSRPPRPSRSRATTARPTTTATRARTRARRATTASCRRRSTTARRAGPTRSATHARPAIQDEGRLGRDGRARADHEPAAVLAVRRRRAGAGRLGRRRDAHVCEPAAGRERAVRRPQRRAVRDASMCCEMSSSRGNTEKERGAQR